MTIIKTQFLVQKVLIGNYKPIIGIYEKIFIINLRNMQMLFIAVN